MSNLTLNLTPPPAMDVSYSGDFTSDKGDWTCPSLPARNTAIFIATLRFVKHDFNLTLSGQLRYNTGHSKELKNMRFTVPIEFSDLIRSIEMTTGVYGGHWKSHTKEDKVLVRDSPIKSPQAFHDKIKQLNLYPVSVKGKEIIAAGRLIGGSNLCLLHAKVEPAQIDLKIRTLDLMFTQIGARYFQRVLQK